MKIGTRFWSNLNPNHFWTLGPLGLPIFYLGTKFGAKMLIDAEIMASNRNPRWHLGYSKMWFMTNGSPWAAVFPPGTEIWCINVVRRWNNYDPKWKSKMADVRHGFSKTWFLNKWVPLGCRFSITVPIKFGAKMLFDAEIMTQNWNPRCRPSAILDFRKPDFLLEMGPLGLVIFHPGTKFGAIMLIDAEIMANKKYVLWNMGICPIASKVGHVTLATPPLGSFIVPYVVLM